MFSAVAERIYLPPNGGISAFAQSIVEDSKNVYRLFVLVLRDNDNFNEDCQQSFKKNKRAHSGISASKGKVYFGYRCQLGIVLSQIIGYICKTLSKPKRNYCTPRKLLAVIKVVEHFYNITHKGLCRNIQDTSNRMKDLHDVNDETKYFQP